jgi:hypothetical protein
MAVVHRHRVSRTEENKDEEFIDRKGRATRGFRSIRLPSSSAVVQALNAVKCRTRLELVELATTTSADGVLRRNMFFAWLRQDEVEEVNRELLRGYPGFTRTLMVSL